MQSLLGEMGDPFFFSFLTWGDADVLAGGEAFEPLCGVRELLGRAACVVTC
jgi:hypothetical protein